MKSERVQFPLVTVRPPAEHDGFTSNEYEEYQLDDGSYVYAVVEFGKGLVIPFTYCYVDWYGDGGLDPSEVLSLLLYQALGGK